jgi:hypothetical protein
MKAHACAAVGPAARNVDRRPGYSRVKAHEGRELFDFREARPLQISPGIFLLFASNSLIFRKLPR